MVKSVKPEVKCPRCEQEQVISLGNVYLADGIWKKYRCKHCGNMFKVFVSEYDYEKVKPSKNAH